jgi:CheY-like chemotaxis protein
MSMPKLNGLQAAKELRELMPGVPIILFTLFADQIRENVDSVDRIVSKHDPSKLMDHVRALLPV